MISTRFDARAIGGSLSTLISVRTSIVEELRSQLRPGEGYGDLLSRLLHPKAELRPRITVPAAPMKKVVPSGPCRSVLVFRGVPRTCRRKHAGHEDDHVWWPYRGRPRYWAD